MYLLCPWTHFPWSCVACCHLPPLALHPTSRNAAGLNKSKPLSATQPHKGSELHSGLVRAGSSNGERAEQYFPHCVGVHAASMCVCVFCACSFCAVFKTRGSGVTHWVCVYINIYGNTPWRTHLFDGKITCILVKCE